VYILTFGANVKSPALRLVSSVRVFSRLQEVTMGGHMFSIYNVSRANVSRPRYVWEEAMRRWDQIWNRISKVSTARGLPPKSTTFPPPSNPLPLDSPLPSYFLSTQPLISITSITFLSPGNSYRHRL